jgi:DNA-binding response OmpR family regulator
MNPNPTSPKKTPFILIVEDDKFLSKMYSVKFTIEGFSAITAPDGEEALKIISRNKPDFILLDMMLPKTPGSRILSKLQENEETRTIPIIALTNLADKEEAQKTLQLGVKEYLVKAMHSPEEVVQKVKQYLNPTPPSPSSPQTPLPAH